MRARTPQGWNSPGCPHLDPLVGLRHHEVAVQKRLLTVLTEARDHRWPNREVVHKMPILRSVSACCLIYQSALQYTAESLLWSS